jgi:hypothetical protein
MREEKVTCDGCGHDLTTRSNSVDYRLVLASESKPGYGAGAYTDMMISSPLEREHHFCGLDCLDHWRARERHEGALWKEWWDKWKEEKGTKTRNCFSYPSPPKETLSANGSQFKAAALEAFPMNANSKRR